MPLTPDGNELEQKQNILICHQECTMFRTVEGAIELAFLASFFAMVSVAYGAVGNLPLV
jgi:hypothetical protein